MKTFTKILLVLSCFTSSAALYSQEPLSTASDSRVVYGLKISPFVRKVLIAMSEKELDYKNIEVLPLIATQARGETPLPEFVEASPLGKIPAYREGSWTITDSSVIIAYLDRKYPQKALYPSEPKLFAETLWYEKYADQNLASITHGKILLQKVVQPKLFGKPTDEKIVEEAINRELPPLLAYLEQELNGKTWICGKEFTAADIAIGVQLTILKNSDVLLSADMYPNLVRYCDALFARDSFKKNI